MADIHDGYYHGRIVSWGLEKNRNGNVQWFAETKIIEESIDPDSVVGGFQPLEKPFKRTVLLYLTPKAVGKSLADLRSIGLPRDADPESIADYLTPHTALSVDFGKAPVLLECRHEDGKDKDGNPKSYERWSIARDRRGEQLGREDKAQLNSLLQEEAEALNKVPI